MHNKTITDISYLKSQITAATETPEMLHKIWRETAYHLDVCQVTNSAHIETYTNGYKNFVVLLIF